jgi:hypothetical protein
MRYKSEPTMDGYYWLRWRLRCVRKWYHVIVWVSEAAWKNSRMICEGARWQNIAEFPNATFYGPLKPPKA